MRFAGALVPCAIQQAQDFDTYRKTVNGTPTTLCAVDAPLTYIWSADRGRFKNDVRYRANVANRNLIVLKRVRRPKFSRATKLFRRNLRPSPRFSAKQPRLC